MVEKKIGRTIRNYPILMTLRDNLLNLLPDKQFLMWKFKYMTGKRLDLKNPKTYNEKLQWLKLYNRNPLYTKLVDKFEVRSFVKNKIGEEYLIPIYGVWDDFSEIDFSKLPDSFVIKTTHDSGGVVICKDKKHFDIESAKKKINKSLKNNYYKSAREWPYKNVKPRIICEKFIMDSTLKDTKDYKFLCFDGQPKIMFISGNRSDKPEADFFDMDFNHLELKRIYPNSQQTNEKPNGFEKMKELSMILSEGIPHVRVDFYEVDNQIYFGEMTFYTGGGFQPFTPESYDSLLGSWINLP